MFKFIFIFYLLTNICDNILSNLPNKNGDLSIMKEFIENQQYREDQLRSQCNLGNIKIELKQSNYEKLYEDFKYYLTDNLSKNIYPVIYGSIIDCNTYEEFIENSYKYENINKKLLYKNMDFTLKDNYPIWNLEFNDLSIDINNIQLKI